MKFKALLPLVCGLSLIASSAFAQTEIKFGHVGGPGSLFDKSATEFAKRANAKTTEVESSHVVFLSHPDAVVNVIVEAAAGVIAKR